MHSKEKKTQLKTESFWPEGKNYNVTMSRFVLLLALFVCISCKESTQKESLESQAFENSNFELGKRIFEGKGQCLSCHQPNHKVIGPSIIEITTIYQDQGADMIAFLKGNADPIVDP